MIKRVLDCVKRLSRYNVNVSLVADGEEGSTVFAVRIKGLAHQRKMKACRRRRHGRRIMSANVGAVDEEEEDDDEGNNTAGNGMGNPRWTTIDANAVQRETTISVRRESFLSSASYWRVREEECRSKKSRPIRSLVSSGC